MSFRYDKPRGLTLSNVRKISAWLAEDRAVQVVFRIRNKTTPISRHVRRVSRDLTIHVRFMGSEDFPVRWHEVQSFECF